MELRFALSFCSGRTRFPTSPPSWTGLLIHGMMPGAIKLYRLPNICHIAHVLQLQASGGGALCRAPGCSKFQAKLSWASHLLAIKGFHTRLCFCLATYIYISTTLAYGSYFICMQHHSDRHPIESTCSNSSGSTRVQPWAGIFCSLRALTHP